MLRGCRIGREVHSTFLMKRQGVFRGLVFLVEVNSRYKVNRFRLWVKDHLKTQYSNSHPPKPMFKTPL